jgi:hypothetical protein
MEAVFDAVLPRDTSSQLAMEAQCSSVCVSHPAVQQGEAFPYSDNLMGIGLWGFFGNTQTWSMDAFFE